jgi:oligopeptide transport system substrate-binding protein
VLRVNFGTEPPSLDPGLVTDVTSANVTNALFDPLVKLDDELEPQPALAESWEQSEEGTTVTFRLRDDGAWTNGDALTAADFEYSWKRVLDPETGADYAYQFYGIVGAEEYNGCEEDCDALRDAVGIRAVDERTLEVRLSSAQPWFVAQTSHSSFLPVHRATVEEHGAKWTEPANIVTSGPFRLTAWRHEESITLERWDEWRDAGSVALERIEGRMIGDATTALQAFEAGEIDACLDRATCVPLAEVDRLEGGDSYVRRPALATQYVGVNLNTVPDLNQRRALAFALDRRVLIDNVTKAGEEPATGFTPEGMPGSESIRQDFIPQEADVEQAREFLEAAEGPKRRLTLVTNNDNESRQVAEAMQAMWAEIGLEVQIRSMEWQQFLEFIGPPANPEADLIYIGWAADYVDAVNFLELWTCRGGFNTSAYCDERYDELLQRARTTFEDEERHELYGQVEALITGPEGALPLIPVTWATYVVLRKPWVEGWEPNELAMFDFTQVSIQEH